MQAPATRSSRVLARSRGAITETTMSPAGDRLDELATAALTRFALDPDAAVTLCNVSENHTYRVEDPGRRRSLRAASAPPRLPQRARDRVRAHVARCPARATASCRPPACSPPPTAGAWCTASAPGVEHAQRRRVRLAARDRARPRRRRGGPRAVPDPGRDLRPHAPPRPRLAAAGRLHPAAVGLCAHPRPARALGAVAGRAGYGRRRSAVSWSASTRRSRRGWPPSVSTPPASGSCTPTSAWPTCSSTDRRCA